eukprot:13317946-Alexandrium_andersonii.AAC.1
MSASLVGSEMCIRDRRSQAEVGHRNGGPGDALPEGAPGQQILRAARPGNGYVARRRLARKFRPVSDGCCLSILRGPSK